MESEHVMDAAQAIIRQAGEGERMWFAGGGTFTWKASAAETGGAFLFWEDTMAGGKRTPWHLHPNEDEAIYVLEGELLLAISGQEHRIGEGGFFVAPRGVPHAFMVESERARVLSFMTPGTGEQFYREAGEPIETDEDVERPPDWDRLRAAAARADSIEVLGPPPFAVAEQR
jgi:quercetin dioxygenase-like cupin family protein